MIREGGREGEEKDTANKGKAECNTLAGPAGRVQNGSPWKDISLDRENLLRDFGRVRVTRRLRGGSTMIAFFSQFQRLS